MRASYMHRVQLVLAGANTYEAAGYTAFAAFFQTLQESPLATAKSEQDPTQGVTLRSVEGYGYSNSAKLAITHLIHYDPSTDKLHIYLVATGAQVAGAVDLSSTFFEFTAISE